MTESIEIPETPCMPQACANYLVEQLKDCKWYIEYGSGASTLQAFDQQVPLIHSIETDGAWLAALEERRSNLTSAYKGIHIAEHVDLGPTGPWGYPSTHERHAAYWQYPMAPWRSSASSRMAEGPPLVLIDGRFRVACMLLTCVYAPADTTILFDDYADREYYHVIEAFATPSEMVDRMAVFRLKRQTPPSLDLLQALMASLQDTR